jgi:hypothetical protein
MVELSTAQVWDAMGKEIFAVLGMVTGKGESRTAGVLYHPENGRVYMTTNDKEWKAIHIAGNPEVSVTIPIAKRIPFVPWVKVPAATITFSATARIIPIEQLSATAHKALLGSNDAQDSELRGKLIGMELRPKGHFVTYGVGVSLLGMRDTEAARGRVAVATESATP